MALTEFGVYFTVALGLALVFIIAGAIFGSRAGNKLTIIEIIVGFAIWTTVFTALGWVVHMIALGAGYID